MRLLHIIFPILVGGVIGYCTNYIAIKMLFRPHKAIYIGKHKLPFTPGIIPKNQKRIAGAVGDAVSEQLLTKEAVMKSVGEAGEKIINKIASYACNSDKSIMEMLPRETESKEIVGSVSTTLTESIIEKAEQIDFDSIIAQFGKETMSSLVNSSPMLAMLFNADMQRKLCERLGNAVRDYINDHGQESVKGFIYDYISEFSHKPVRDLLKSEADKDKLKNVLEEVIGNILEKHGTAFLDYINVKDIVAERIEAMEAAELEKLVLSVMKQELQAVINLGAAIGAIIGIVNIFL